MIADLLPALAHRCFCCGAQPDAVPVAAPAPFPAAGEWRTCPSCGARSRSHDAARLAAELARILDTPPHAFPRPGERDWFLDGITARIAATARGLWLDLPGFVAGHDDEVPRGRLVPLETQPVPTIGLVALARPDDPLLDGFIEENRRRFHTLTIVLDQAEPAPGGGGNVRFVARALAGDFAAQRNAGMATLRTGWAFHLDLDETIADPLAAALPHLAAHAERAGLAAIGLPRRNHVDGRLADLFPDTQYRLVRRDQRFAGRVHERPAACADWTRTTIALAGAIDHHLSRARVVERTGAYDRLGQQAERHGDEAALLRPFAG